MHVSINAHSWKNCECEIVKKLEPSCCSETLDGYIYHIDVIASHMEVCSDELDRCTSLNINEGKLDVEAFYVFVNNFIHSFSISFSACLSE